MHLAFKAALIWSSAMCHTSTSTSTWDKPCVASTPAPTPFQAHLLETLTHNYLGQSPSSINDWICLYKCVHGSTQREQV